MNFSLAHLSDLHLGPLPKGATFEKFALKRVIGGLSWSLNRSRVHRLEIANALRSDIVSAHPSHVAFTGDLVNIAAEAEFIQGLKWLQDFGKGDWISFTPGNHDAYVPIPWEKSLGRFSEYMTSDMHLDAAFPFIRLRRNVALIGLNSASRQSLFRAGGDVGAAQRNRLAECLRDLGKRGFYRVVMIHHPPAINISHRLRALSDARETQAILSEEGAELVLHGHNHVRSLTLLDGKGGKIPVIGVPSASMAIAKRHDAAAWNLFVVSRTKGQWQTQVSVRQWNPHTKMMVDGENFALPPRA